MPFPEHLRVVYEKNPLEEVICQLRFPTILRIDTETPAAFQEQVRKLFPIFKEKPAIELPDGLPAEIVRLIGERAPFRAGPVTYEFSSADAQWTLSLTRGFLALTTNRYERWEAFKEMLTVPLGALVGNYSPAFFTRLGLRYRDVVRRSKLGLEGTPWGELLKPHVAGVLASPEIAGAVEHAAQEIVIGLRDKQSKVRLRHGLALDDETKESCYLIDCDFFLDRKTELPHATEKLDYLNQQAGRLFRWCITERLHTAMVPRPI